MRLDRSKRCELDIQVQDFRSGAELLQAVQKAALMRFHNRYAQRQDDGICGFRRQGGTTSLLNGHPRLLVVVEQGMRADDLPFGHR